MPAKNQALTTSEEAALKQLGSIIASLGENKTPSSGELKRSVRYLAETLKTLVLQRSADLTNLSLLDQELKARLKKLEEK